MNSCHFHALKEGGREKRRDGGRQGVREGEREAGRRGDIVYQITTNWGASILRINLFIVNQIIFKKLRKGV